MPDPHPRSPTLRSLLNGKEPLLKARLRCGTAASTALVQWSVLLLPQLLSLQPPPLLLLAG